MQHADYIFAAAAVALQSLGGTFLWEAPVQAGLSLENAPLPAIVLGDYSTTAVGMTSRTEAAQLTLYFADSKPGQGDSPEAHHAALERMQALMTAFFAALDSNYLVQIDTIRATPFSDSYASKLDGLGVQFTLTVPVDKECAPGVEPVVSGFNYSFAGPDGSFPFTQ